jgi:diaminopimelate epimerase
LIQARQHLKIFIEKLVSAGNDFVFALEGRDTPAGWQPSAATVRAICDRHFGVGADGFVLIKQLEERKFKWVFFNSDGSRAAMCGNAARAAACFLTLKRNSSVELLTDFGVVQLEALGPEDFRVAIDYSKKKLELREIVGVPDNYGELEKPVLIDTGVPHVVIECHQNILEENDKSRAAPFRWVKEAGPEGANVTFFKKRDANSIDAITFERGVEDYTLSCGTGVLAAAIVFSGSMVSGYWRNEINIKNPGGELRVDSKRFPNELLLSGPARNVFRTEINLGEP